MGQKTALETKLEESIKNAAAQQAKATNVDDAERWQGIINQNTARLVELRS